MNDPWSIWHPTIRAIRAHVSHCIRTTVLAPYFATDAAAATAPSVTAAPNTPDSVDFEEGETQSPMRVATLLDRLMIRPAGVKISGEAWHRDIIQGTHSAMPLNGHMEVFGGWTNFDSASQSFRCVPGSHRNPDTHVIYDVRHMKGGFASFSDSEKAGLEAAACTVAIPPGHHIIFFQHIAHTIVKNTNPQPIYRLFAGFVACNDPEWQQYIFGGNDELSRLVTEQAAACTPSGQPFPMYAQLHLCFKNKPFKVWQCQPYAELNSHRHIS
jgi:hypothetical protein